MNATQFLAEVISTRDQCTMLNSGTSKGQQHLKTILLFTLMQGFERHRNFTGHEPDAVVYSSLLWDMQRWGHYESEKVATKELSANTLAEWSEHFQKVLRFIQVCTCCNGPFG